MEDSSYLTVNSVSTITRYTTTIEFQFPALRDHCLDLSTLSVIQKIKMLTGDNEPVKVYEKPDFTEPMEPADHYLKYDPVGFSNVGPTAMFSKVGVWVNDTCINSTDADIAYRKFIEDTINYTKQAKVSMLAGSGYHAGKKWTDRNIYA